MSDAAQTAPPLFGRLRSSFSSLSGAQPVAVSASITDTTTQPLTTADKLATLEQILGEVEQQAAVAIPVVAPTPLATPQPQPQLQPQIQPQQPYQARQQNVGLVAQATPVAVDQALYQQQVLQAQTSGAKTTKETFTAASTTTEAVTNAPAVEAATSMQYVEQEPVPEISPEVSEYLTHVENHANQQPQEIVIAEDQQNIPLATNYAPKSVIVLPITPETEQEGKRKSPLESIRWLVEWSFKLMKAFSGQIIYREVETKHV